MTTPTRPSGRDSIREPIHTPWIWVAITAVVLAGVPFYFPEGAIDPIWFGIPYWLVIVIVASVAMSAVISVVCLRCWSLAEPQETAAERARNHPDAPEGDR